MECCVKRAEYTFVAPAHFQVRYNILCAPFHGGGGYHTNFGMVGYDGTYQSVILAGVDGGAASDITDIQATASKWWTFYVWDAEKAQCSYDLVAMRVPT